MPEREKVYFVNGGKFTKTEMVCKALQQCTMPSDSEGYETQCGDCPYFDPDCSVSVCKQQLCADALAMLKEQEPAAPIVGEAEDMPWIAWYVCPGCKLQIDYLDKFCRHCGKGVNWE